MKELLRVYEESECGRDGYPLNWHVHRMCQGHGCELCEQTGSIKRMIRQRHGNRCLRCGHPYHVGREYRMEIIPQEDGTVKRVLWSPCDWKCTHTGEVEIEGDLHVMTEPGDIFSWISKDFKVEAAYRILTVHHLNETKADCRWWNLVSLCQRCHLHIQKKVDMGRVWPLEHSEWFKPFVAGYYAFVYLGEEISREEAQVRMDELLALERMA